MSTPTTDLDPELVSVKGTAQLLGVSRATVYNLLSSGELESVKIGSRRLIPRSAITAKATPAAALSRDQVAAWLDAHGYGDIASELGRAS